MLKLKFYDVKGKKTFYSDKYKFVIKRTKAGNRKFAICEAPSGIDAWRIVSMSFKG